MNIIVNMSQMSAMVEGTYGSAGMLPPTGGQVGAGLLMVTVALTAADAGSAVLGGYKRVEKIMTALLIVILVCFIIVAIKGLLDWQTWLALAPGSCRTCRRNVPVVGSDALARRA